MYFFIISLSYLAVTIVSVIRHLLSFCILYLNCFHFPWPDDCLFIRLVKKEVFLGYIVVWFLFQWLLPSSSLPGFVSLSFCQWFTNILQWMLISFFTFYSSSVQFSSVAQSCSTLCDPMECSTPGLPVHHQLPESTQTHVHWVGDAIQPSHPLSSPSPPALNLSQHQGLFQWISSSHQVVQSIGVSAST